MMFDGLKSSRSLSGESRGPPCHIARSCRDTGVTGGRRGPWRHRLPGVARSRCRRVLVDVPLMSPASAVCELKFRLLSLRSGGSYRCNAVSDRRAEAEPSGSFDSRTRERVAEDYRRTSRGPAGRRSRPRIPRGPSSGSPGRWPGVDPSRIAEGPRKKVPWSSRTPRPDRRSVR